jgi:hypothetical protein
VCAENTRFILVWVQCLYLQSSVALPAPLIIKLVAGVTRSREREERLLRSLIGMEVELKSCMVES